VVVQQLGEGAYATVTEVINLVDGVSKAEKMFTD
jgi:hypothetical protein